MKKVYKAAELSKVQLTDTYLDEAFIIEVKNLLLLDPDRLLAGFRETAGILSGKNEEEITELMKGKSRYTGGWEDGLIGGHTLGHYIAALAQACVNPACSDEEEKSVSDRLDYILNALYECQQLIKDTKEAGFIFGAAFPTKEFRDNPLIQFDNVEKGLSDPFKEAWVPWYTMHKIISGLNASYKLAGKETGLKVVNALGLWIINRVLGWSVEVNKTVLSIEYGGMNDCLYELYEINRELKESSSCAFLPEYEKLKEAAHRFDETALFEKILSGEKNILNNTHANTTIPKFIGALARYETDHTETKYLEYAEGFFDMVVSRHTYVTGGNSENEHFGEDNVLDAERTEVNNETCNTYNMLKFSRRLFEQTGKKKYLDYAERTFINAIAPSQNHETGFTTYFQPMATGYQKVFNTLEGNFWCCTGTGYENFTKLQDGIYFENEKELMVSLYLASKYENEEFTVSMDCDFTASDEVSIVICSKTGNDIKKDVLLRIPAWLKDKMVIKLEGQSYAAAEKDGFLIVPADIIKDKAELILTLPMGLTAHNLQDGKNTYAFMYGPYVLSARLGTAKIRTRAHGICVLAAAMKAVDSDEITITSEKSVEDFIRNISLHLVKRENEMEFDLKGTDRELTFTTHFNQYKESYGIYWKFRI